MILFLCMHTQTLSLDRRLLVLNSRPHPQLLPEIYPETVQRHGSNAVSRRRKRHIQVITVFYKIFQWRGASVGE